MASAAPWSFSKWKAFNTCPLQFQNEKVLKRYPQVETEAMLYGTEFHEAAEFYIQDGTPMPPRFNFAVKALDNLNALEGDKYCEQKLGVTENLTPCAFDADDVWWRGIGDLNIVNDTLGWTIDYKTGANSRYADQGQLELMALGMFTHYPQLEEVKAGLFFVVAKDLVKAKFYKEDVPDLWQKWIKNFKIMESAFKSDVWNMKESGLCKRHCPVMECPANGRAQ